MSARILLYDLETSANVGYTWGLYEQNVISFVSEWDILAVGWKWLGESKSQVKTRADFRDKTDRSLVKHLWSLLDEADVVIGHNSIEFDNRKANARFAYHGLGPTAPFANVDTCRLARSAFKFNSNKLDDLAKHMGLGQKKKTDGFDLWKRSMAGDKAALKKMGAYCRQDVELLERVYKKLRPYAKNHPNVALIEHGQKDGCPVCGSLDVGKFGLRYKMRSVTQGMVCGGCGARFEVPLAKRRKAA